MTCVFVLCVVHVVSCVVSCAVLYCIMCCIICCIMWYVLYYVWYYASLLYNGCVIPLSIVQLMIVPGTTICTLLHTSSPMSTTITLASSPKFEPTITTTPPIHGASDTSVMQGAIGCCGVGIAVGCVVMLVVVVAAEEVVVDEVVEFEELEPELAELEFPEFEFEFVVVVDAVLSFVPSPELEFVPDPDPDPDPEPDPE